MADPLSGIFGRVWHPGETSRRPTTEIFSHYDRVRMSAFLIQKHELATWFEPNWSNARMLARWFPHTTIWSIPLESDTETLRRTPGWRRARAQGIL